MNIAELLGVVYIAVNASGTSPGDAFKAIGVVVVWCLIGVVWVLSNPKMRGSKVFDDPGQREAVAVHSAADGQRQMRREQRRAGPEGPASLAPGPGNARCTGRRSSGVRGQSRYGAVDPGGFDGGW